MEGNLTSIFVFVLALFMLSQVYYLNVDRFVFCDRFLHTGL